MPTLPIVVSGVPGKLAAAIARAAAGAPDIELSGVHNPHRSGEWQPGEDQRGEGQSVPYLSIEGVSIADVVVEAGPDHTVLENLSAWRDAGCAVVVGTSGFTAERIRQVVEMWEGVANACLIVPNFSIGAVLAMRFAEAAAAHFATSEVIERHSAAKADAPSGTALHTAARIAAGGGSSGGNSQELVGGALGATVDGVRVHSLRLEGLLSHQEVAMTNPGEQFSIVHQSTSYDSFAAGALAAVRGVGGLEGVHVGLDAVLTG